MSNLIGEILNNRFRVDEFDQISGCGYKALDITQNKPYLLKFLPKNLADDEVFLKHFFDDVKKISTLKHPNLHGLYGAEYQNDCVYLVYDYINAVTLAELNKSKNYALTPRNIIDIFTSLCDALEYLHENGYVYHDLRPKNILIKKSGDLLLKNAGFLMFDGVSETEKTNFITPVYMAPEQIEGFESSPASNVYSLGIILFEIMTHGKFPFTGERVTDYGSKIEKLIREKTLLPPISPCFYNPEISPEIEQVILESLSRKPENRYQNMTNFKKAFFEVYQ